ncbi:hypothetical protein [Pseudomonas frederiksbergensis]|nr:hypothetical protein [Pseudomonas frederiksbergensis]
MLSSNHETIQNRLAHIATFSATRLPHHGRHGSRVTIFPSRKNNRPLMCESLLEAAFCLELERRRDVLYYLIHPYTITIAAIKVSYTPDFEITFVSGEQQLAEVKNDQSMECQRVRIRLSKIVELLGEQNCLLECLPLHHFYHTTRTGNLEYLYYHAYNDDGRTDAAIQKYLHQQPRSVPLRQLMVNTFPFTAIAHALFYNAIHCNLRKPITGETMVWIQ